MAKDDDISTIMIKKEHVALMEEIIALMEHEKQGKATIKEKKEALAEQLGTKAGTANKVLTMYIQEREGQPVIRKNKVVSVAVEQALIIHGDTPSDETDTDEA